MLDDPELYVNIEPVFSHTASPLPDTIKVEHTEFADSLQPASEELVLRCDTSNPCEVHIKDVCTAQIFFYMHIITM